MKIKKPLTPVLYFYRRIRKASVEAALQYNDGYSDNILSSLIQNPHLKDGEPTRLDEDAITKAMNDYARKTLLKEKDKNLEGIRLPGRTFCSTFDLGARSSFAV